MRRYLWVIEVWDDGGWNPTDNVAHTRTYARALQKDGLLFRAKKTRVVKYTPMANNEIVAPPKHECELFKQAGRKMRVTKYVREK